MKIKVLGSSAVELPNANLTSFLVDDKILIDAGTIGAVLDEDRQWKIRHVLLSHSHLDHIKDLPFLADNISISRKKHSVSVYSSPEVNNALKKNIFNNVIWPDFTEIPSSDNPIIRLKNIKPGKPFTIDHYNITTYKVNHAVPAVSYLLEDRKGKRLIYIGDAGPSNTIWKSVVKKIHGLIIEASLPNRYKSMALETGHLTPELLASELNKMKHTPEMIFITHCKPGYRKKIKEELKKLNILNIRILKDGDELDI
ncbi:MAG: 3',5'-cyclic-nucleotide phosphodiesterase [Nitrospiraceae bacterium]|nr:MAG: 3',5'-cyclic-nucleotide phosphodiesterase [Nitrospiraceae bacterium]